MIATPLLEPGLLRRLEALALQVRRSITGQVAGERRSRRYGRSVEFADFRSYTPGDDFRLIDWNAYARLDRFLLRLFVAEEELPLNPKMEPRISRIGADAEALAALITLTQWLISAERV